MKLSVEGWSMRRAISLLALVALTGVFGCGSDNDNQVSPPICTLGAAGLDFGSVEVGQTKDLTLTITNTGQGTLTGTVVETCADYSIQGNASYSLGANASATITIRFAPTGTGVRACVLGLSGGCSNVPLTGIGAPTACGLSTTSLNFGTVAVGVDVDRTFTITNNGSTTLAGTVSSPCPEFTIVGNASYSLAPAAAATITVRLTPTSGGAKSCTIETGNGLCADVSATGSGQELASPTLGPLATYSHTFASAGTYPYHCEFHGAMQATVVVDPNSVVTTASVSIVNSTATGFSPQSVTIAPGGTVTWTNNDSVNHTVTSD
jgi:plastocyanin